MWYYCYEPGSKGQGSGKGKGKSKSAQAQRKPEPEATQLTADLAGLRNTVDQLREANKTLRAKQQPGSGDKAPQPRMPAGQVEVDKKAAWKCQSCGLDHHNGGLKQCRGCAAPRAELQAATPGLGPVTVSGKYWGPVHDKASQRVFKRLPEAGGLLLAPGTAQAGSNDEVMEPCQEEQKRLRDNAAATVAFLQAQTPVDEGLLKTAKAKLEALADKPLEKPDQDRGLLLVILDKQRLFNVQEAAKDKAAVEASEASLLKAQQAHSALAAELEAAAQQREKLLGNLRAALEAVDKQCFFDCQERSQAQVQEAAPAPTQTASKEEAASLLAYLEQLGGTGGDGPPPACAALLVKLKRLSGISINVEDLADGWADDARGTTTPLQLPPSPSPDVGTDDSSAAAVEAAREMLAATKGANKGPHPLGKGTAVGGHSPY